MSHPDDSTIEAFVMGALEDDTDFVSHVGSCDVCSLRLQREASIEVAMLEVQARAAETLPAEAVAEPQIVPAPSKVARRRIGYAAVAAVLVAQAAGVALWMNHRAQMSRDAAIGVAAAKVVSCPDDEEQLACIAEAHRTGSRIEYPTDPRLIELGSHSGASVMIDARFSDGVPPSLDLFLDHAKKELETCASESIVSQNAAVVTGAMEVRITIDPRGNVTAREPSYLVRDEGVGADRELTPNETAFSRCLMQAVDSFHFDRSEREVHVAFLAKYVWRD